MGSLTKRTATVPTYQPSVVSVPTPTVTESAPESASEEDIREDVRQESLLRRSRGRLGTVFTGFRGLLSESANSADTTRKTLLGE